MPKYLHNQCAYHRNQVLTNFCTCTQCLLPVCPTCIKLHSEQHATKRTNPQYQKMDDIFNSVHNTYTNFVQNLYKLKEQLLQVQKVKKQNQNLILDKIKIYRNKIIREFQRSLTDLQYQLTKTFQSEDHQFIIQIQQIDKSIDRIHKSLAQNIQNLQSEQNGLRTVIFHISKNVQAQYIEQISAVNDKLKDILKKNLYLTIDQSCLDDIRKSIEIYMKVSMINWKPQELKIQKK